MTKSVVEKILERGISFAPESIRWIFAGTKTQTRRYLDDPPKNCHSPSICNCPPESWGAAGKEWHFQGPGGPQWHLKCPYGRGGGRLWVKEAFRTVGRRHRGTERRSLLYPATCYPDSVKPPITSARHMPRWASRLTLDIVMIRAHRLTEITEADAIAEGVEQVGFAPDGKTPHYRNYTGGGAWANARCSYFTYWDSINRKRGHGSETNPWVWAIEFRRTTDGRA